MPCRTSLVLAAALTTLTAGTALAQPGVPIVGPIPAYRPVPHRGHAAQEGALRLRVTPKDAEVFVDGYLMGIVDDFDGAFQRLHVEAGPHTLEVYRSGFRIGRQKIFVGPHATLRVTYALVTLGPNDAPDPRPVVKQVEARREPLLEGAGPRDPRRGPGRPWPMERRPDTDDHSGPRRDGRERQATYGTLAVHVQPQGADVLIDGERWDVDRDGRLELQLAEGRHRVEVRARGARPFTQEVEVRRGEVTPLNVSLAVEGGR